MHPFKLMSTIGGGPGVAISDATASRGTIAPTPATATYSLNNTGIGDATLPGGGDAHFTWLLHGAAGDYECRATLLSGTAPSGSALSTWISLGAGASWSLTKPGTVGIRQCSLTMEIRRASSGTVLDTATVGIEAEVN